MTNKKLTLLGIIAAVMVVLVLVQSGTKTGVSVDNDSIKYLIQGLDPSTVQSISIKGTGEQQVELVKSGDGFVVKQLSDYPAKVSEINDMITKCLDIKVGRIYTSKPENFEDLGVSEEKAAYIVKFSGSDGKLVTGVIVSEGKDGKNYVRRVDSNDVYIASDYIWLNASAQNYAEQKLTEVAKDKITQIDVTAAEGSYSITQADGKAVLQNIPEGKVVKQAECDKVLGAITSLRFDDVKKAADVKDVKFDGTYVCKLSDSTVYTIKTGKKDDKTYATLTAEFTDKTPVMKEKGVESDEELKKKEAKLLSNEAAVGFEKRHSGWVYVLPSYSADNLVMPFSSLVEDKPVAAEPAKEEAPAQVQEQPVAAPAAPQVPAPAVAPVENAKPAPVAPQPQPEAPAQTVQEKPAAAN